MLRLSRRGLSVATASAASSSTSGSTAQTFAAGKTGSANKKAQFGRVNSGNLYAYNKDLKQEALKERTYWEVNKDAHPVNRWSWLRWQKKIKSESVFTERVNSFPIDQRYKIKKLMAMPNRAPLILPIVMGFYFVYCFLRYYVFGTTPSEASVGTNRFVAMLPRAPGTQQ
jgi:hypothetical protein